jgi:PAS domain S-box-containing protein
LFVLLSAGASAFLFFNLVLMVNRRLYIETEEMEKILNENAMQLQLIFKTTSIGFGILVNRVFREVNDSFCEMIGYSREEIIGTESRKFYPTDEEYHEIGQMYLKIMQLGFVTAETRLLRKDNKIIFVIMSISALDKNDLSKGVVFSIVDITERKHLEEKSNYLASFPELNPNPVLELDQDCNLLYQNPICKRIFPVLGKKGLDHPFLADWPQVVKKLQDTKWSESIIREIKLGNAYFEQVIYPVAKNQIRIYARNITTRKRAEEDLKISEQNFHNSLESLLTGIRIRDSEDRILFLNQAYLDIFGYKNIEEAKSASPVDHYTPESYADYLLRKKQINRGEPGPATMEVDIIRKDGAIRHLQVTGKRVLWGDKMQLQTFYNDITEQKRVEAALKLSEQNFRNSMDSSFLGIYIANDAWKPMYMNQALLDIFGYENFEAVKASPPHEHYTPESYADYLQRSNRLSRGESNPDNFEIDIIRKDGAIRHLQVFRRQLFWDGQQQYQVLYNDVTERKQTEEALKESEARYKTLFESAAEGIMIADIETQQQKYVNPAICKMLGYTQEELTKMRVSDIHPRDSRDYAVAEFNAQAMGKKTTVTLPCLKKDGSVIYMDISATKAVIDGRECNIGFFTEITERKQAEEKIMASLSEKETLLKEVHHRVKNNMQVISSLLRLQEGKVKDKNAAALLRDSQNRIQSMALVYNKLYQSDNLASINMTDYINELIAGLIKSYVTSHSLVSVNVVPGEVLLSIDLAIPCGLVINELVTNSLKYAFPENRKGQISVSLKEDNDRELELVVSDDGVGMPDDINLVDTGTLGIRLVTNLVQDQLGGKIELNCNQGTKYQISFPRAKEEIK